jgi:prephenate dehydrogenase
VALIFRRMVVVGVGLIGGSLALDVRKRGLVDEIIGVGRAEKNLRFAQRGLLMVMSRERWIFPRTRIC